MFSSPSTLFELALIVASQIREDLHPQAYCYQGKSMSATDAVFVGNVIMQGNLDVHADLPVTISTLAAGFAFSMSYDNSTPKLVLCTGLDGDEFQFIGYRIPLNH
jgi:hypothetical protein